MANNLTQGVIQVLDNDVQSINNALLRILEIIDGLKGLRGITNLFDQTTVSRPQQSNAAVRLDNLSDITSDIADPFLAVQRAPGVSLLDVDMAIADAAHPWQAFIAPPPAVPTGAYARYFNLYGGVETMDLAALILVLKDTGIMA